MTEEKHLVGLKVLWPKKLDKHNKFKSQFLRNKTIEEITVEPDISWQYENGGQYGKIIFTEKVEEPTEVKIYVDAESEPSLKEN